MSELAAVRQDQTERVPEPAVREPLWRDVVGGELRGARLEAGRTLADVAGRSGVSVQYLSEVERGRKEPSSEVLRAVAGGLDLTLLDLTVRVARRLSREAAGVRLAA
ncbi:helix-turn-helix domain-containing protein [Nocardioides flavescens]|uniref:Helix-turn-helix domain-containing protein n=1 Tax=Nocardioides flavescens TaxID=2691959 RepID=A0A6L7EMX7_9ACTN|nr:helix-turn-helix transcriptional regulator [Nocardioides flavescens]MXG88683.1 helix-turn-helix domain-containing protein [Nocardioides flavescens]